MTISTTSRRVVAVDITRALAILGMIAVHSLYAYNDQGEPSLSYSLAAGKSAAAFAILAGVSISFIVGGKRLAGPAAPGKIASLMARAAIIGAIGLLLGYTDSEVAVVILPYYAVMFAMAIPLAALSTRALVVAAVSLLVVMPVFSQWVRAYVVTGLPRQLDFTYLFTAPAEFASDIFLTGQFPALVWMFYICVGLIIGRCNLRSPRTIAAMLGIGVVMIGVAAFASWYILQLAGVSGHLRNTVSAEHAATLFTFGGDGTVPTTSWWWLALNAPHTGTPFDLLTTTGYAMLVLGFMLGLERFLRNRIKQAFTLVTFPLAAAGTMALTVYVGHIIFINSPLDVSGAVSTFWWQLAVIAGAASVWSVLFDRGPLEGLVTSITKFVERRVNAKRQRAHEVVVHR